MTAPTDRGIFEQLAYSTVNHPIAAPLAWGLGSGLTLGPMLVGGTLAGYIVGRAGVGRGLSILACAGGSVLSTILIIQSMLPTCPSCVDAYLVAPATIPILLIPFLIGVWLGGRARNRAAATA